MGSRFNKKNKSGSLRKINGRVDLFNKNIPYPEKLDRALTGPCIRDTEFKLIESLPSRKCRISNRNKINRANKGKLSAFLLQLYDK